MEDQLSTTDTSDGYKTGIQIIPFSQVVQSGAAATHIEEVPPTPDDVAIIMYTSGSTGCLKELYSPTGT
ncbi:hypothetical protein L9F63_025672 [Diploptera punctata]|uniref:AMP-dependent synthetase/ligase domain-containing protein n=1 Tax=Diploptera punctata TaxID=6984 RepID=A0AAD7Z7M5_DIPPU|nr:hypothetical protein L9F63_025672 [Diploptera punctata]